MVNPDRLKKMADDRNQSQGEAFANVMMVEIEKAMILRAGAGDYDLHINHLHILNKEGWLSDPTKYKPIIARLKSAGFFVAHSDDVRDGTYLIIRWL